MSNKTIIWIGAVTMMAVAGICQAADTEALRQGARKIYQERQEAVVAVSAVLKLEMGGQTQDRDLNLYGTVLDENGLTVVSCTMVDPFATLGDSLKMEGAGAATPKGTPSKIKIMLADGTEIPAKIAYEDPDMDLAFLVPEKGEKTLPKFCHVNPAEIPEADVLDQLVTLQRLPKSFDRKAAVGFCAVVSKLTKPRTVYILDGFEGQPGQPVFRGDGQMQGLMVVRKQDNSASGGRLQFGGATVALPMKYILRGMEQARTAKPEEKKAVAKPAVPVASPAASAAK